MVKTMVIVLIAALLGGTGHVFLAKGMRPVGDLTEAPSDRLGGMVARAVSNPWLIFGVVLQAGSTRTPAGVRARAGAGTSRRSPCPTADGRSAAASHRDPRARPARDRSPPRSAAGRTATSSCATTRGSRSRDRRGRSRAP